MARDAERPSADSVQRLFELSLDMLGTASTDGYFTLLNPAWERVLGWTREELMAVPFIDFVHPDDVDASVEHATRMAGPGQPDGRRVREPLPHARRRLPLAALDGGGGSGLQALRGQGRDRPPGGRGRTRRGRPADPPLRGAAPHADRQPARHHRVPARSRPPDPDRRRRGDQPPRLARRGQVPRPPGGRAVRRGPRGGARALADQLSRCTSGRAAGVRVRQRRADVRGPGGARARRRRVRRVGARRRARHRRSAPMPGSRSRAARASRRRSRSSAGSRSRATTWAS